MIYTHSSGMSHRNISEFNILININRDIIHIGNEHGLIIYVLWKGKPRKVVKEHLDSLVGKECTIYS